MNNKDVAAKVVDRIVDLINQGGALPWVKPWSKKANTVEVIDGYKVITLQPQSWNRKGVEYKGVNMYLPGGEYITFNQCKTEGGTVKKGAHGYPVVYWNFKECEVENADGEKEVKKIPILKYYTVFNVKDCDGIEQKHFPAPQVIKIPITHEEPIDGNRDLNKTAESIIADYIARAGNGFEVKRDSVTDRAYYSPFGDYVSVPIREQYKTAEEYYSTLFHELGHSTGHATRLNRFTGSAACASFGSQEYSREELVAEATAASVLNAIGMESANSFRNSAAYIKSWAGHIKNDPMMYITAMTRAQAAFDLIVGSNPVSPENDPGDGEPEKPVEEVKPEKPVANEKPVTASNKKQLSAATRFCGIERNNRPDTVGWYDLDTPDNESGMLLVMPYAMSMIDSIPLSEELKAGNPEKRSTFIKLFEDYRFAACDSVSVPSIAELKKLIADDKKARDLKERKYHPPLYDFGDGRPAVNAIYLLDLLTIIGGDCADCRCGKETSAIYLNRNGNEAVLLPVRKPNN